MIKDRQEIAVQAVSFHHQSGTVLYARLPYVTETIAGHRTSGAGDKHRLASILWEHLVGMEGSLWTDYCFSNSADLPIQVVHDPLGRPQLLLGDCDGPAISFSEGLGKTWAALCTDKSDIGIDAAGIDEFSTEYPFGRVFQTQELQHALRLTSGDLKKASALLWSIKEAAVKALGCAFHLVDPRQICVYPSAIENDGWYIFTVCLSGKALVLFPMLTSRRILVRSFFQEKMWLSIAYLNWQLNMTEKL